MGGSTLRAVALLTAAVIALMIILTVVIMCIGFLRASEYWAEFTDIRFPRILVSTAYPTLKSGDIILFVATAHSLTTSMLMQNHFSHVGIVVELNGLLFLSEATQRCEMVPPRPGKAAVYTRAGSDLTPLLTRLEYYCGEPYLMALQGPLTDATKSRLARLAREFCPYPTLGQVAKELMGIATRTRHCFQHVGYILDSLGLIPKNEKSLEDKGFIGVCGAITGLPGAPLRTGHSYKKPIRLLYDCGSRA